MAATSSASASAAPASAPPAAAAAGGAGTVSSAPPASTAASSTIAPSVPGRKVFVHEGRVIYEWEQDISEVRVFIRPPRGVTAKMVECKITASHLKLGLKGNPPFMDEELAGLVVPSDSTWFMDDGELQIVLSKARKAELWTSACRGHAELDAASKLAAQKQLLLDRFQEEHPGFDFSGAEINGMVPDARDFMGGIKRV